MARVNVRVDCSPFGLGLQISLAGIEDMIAVRVNNQTRAATPDVSLESKCYCCHFNSSQGAELTDTDAELTMVDRIPQVVLEILPGSWQSPLDDWSEWIPPGSVLPRFLFHWLVLTVCVVLPLRLFLSFCALQWWKILSDNPLVLLRQKLVSHTPVCVSLAWLRSYQGEVVVV